MLTSTLLTLCFPTSCLGCSEEISPYREVSLPLPGSNQRFPADDSTEPDAAPTLPAAKFDFATAFDSHWCPTCWQQLNRQEQKCCRKCGAGLYQDSPFPNACALCADADLRFARAVAVGNYRGLLQSLVIRMKNQHDEQLAIHLGKRLAYELAGSNFLDKIDLIVPVPTHWWRRVRRGFQAAEVIADSVAAVVAIPSAGQIIRCIRGTQKQGTLSSAGRFNNVRGAFAVRSGADLADRTVLVIDDVMTSGATTSEVARMLISRGAAKVYVGVIARGARVS